MLTISTIGNAFADVKFLHNNLKFCVALILSHQIEFELFEHISKFCELRESIPSVSICYM